ncbi:formimidoylglutamase [Vicingaceae bacterium]|jgi:formiminoglutamase|nr:formimidoylglutamase [Vicingaceae bacterium]
MEFLDFVEGVDLSKINHSYVYEQDQLKEVIRIRTIDQFDSFELKSTDQIAILGVLEDRGNKENMGAAMSPNVFRSYFYKLYKGIGFDNIIDLGNIKPGNSLSDTYFAVTETVSQLMKNGVIPIIIGGSKDLAYANFLAYEKLEQTVNHTSIDSAFNIGDSSQEINSKNFLSKIVLHQPNYLFNFSNIGYQSYFVSRNEVNLIDSLFFDTYRLGMVRADIRENEPIIRNADFVSFDISSIRQSEAPACAGATPNGLFGDEACQLARYAGMSDKLTSIGFYEVNPTLDFHGQTSHLLAQMIWYFMDGVFNRKQDFPACNKTEYIKYTVAMEEQKTDITFYKSEKSDRWFMDVPYPNAKKSKYERHLLVPCSYNDYLVACNNEIPDRWVQTLKKLR